MSILVGTSGYSHSEWKGSFYPDKFSQKKMLEYYSERFATVELNYTFRQLPTPEVVQAWGERTPDAFRFVLKGPQEVTHFQLLRGSEEDTARFLDVASAMKDRLGPILWQLPPTFKKHVERLDAFLKHIGGRAKAAFEFREASWFDDEVYDCLRTHSAALAFTDRDDMPQTGLVHTANWGYLRMWGANYTEGQLHKLLADIRSQKWNETYVIFTHMEQGISASLASRFKLLVGA